MKKFWVFLLSGTIAVIEYLEWENAGVLLVGGCGSRSTIEHSPYPLKAYEMGKIFG